MRFFAITALFGFLGNAVAGMSCTDTLRLTSLVVSRQSLHNSATLGAWSTKVLTKLEASTVLDAAPIGLPAAEPGIEPEISTALHFTRIVTDTCTDGAVTPFDFWRVVDTFRLTANSSRSQIGSVEFKTDMLPVRRVTDSYFQVGGKMVHPKNHWSSDLFDIGLVQDGDTIGASSTWFIGRSFRKSVAANATVTGISVAKAVTYKLFPLQIENAIATALAAFQPSVDSIGSGGIDSTRFDVVKFRYCYASTLPTGVFQRPDRKLFTAKSTSDGWLITLPVAAAVEIVSPDGRVARRISAGERLLWDGLDQAGGRVQPGIWYAHATGLGVVSLLVR